MYSQQGLDEGNQELDNIIASSLQQLESARAFYEHMQARAKKADQMFIFGSAL